MGIEDPDDDVAEQQLFITDPDDEGLRYSAPPSLEADPVDVAEQHYTVSLTDDD